MQICRLLRKLFVVLQVGLLFQCRTIPQSSVRSRALVRSSSGQAEVTDANLRTSSHSSARAVEVSVGDYHSCARTSNNQVRCWGGNQFGQIGDGSRVSRLLPFTIESLANVQQVAVGKYYSCARLLDGTVWCWGDNSYGNLGDGTLTQRSEPTQVQLVRNTVDLAVGEHGGCARTRSGEVWCWGAFRGQNNTTAGEIPGFRGAVAIALSDNRALAIMPDGRVMGIGTIARMLHNFTPVPMSVAQPPERIFLEAVEVTLLRGSTDIVLTQQGGCARSANREVICWGAIAGYSTGVERIGFPLNARSVPEFQPSDRLVGGGYSLCGITPGRSVRCIGPQESAVVRLGSVVSYSVASQHQCAVRGDGSVWCWGNNSFGQLGQGVTTSDHHTVLSFAQPPVDIASGTFHSCARLRDGTVMCWGRNEHAELGNGTTTVQSSPVLVRDLSNVTAMDVGGSQSCAVASGSVKCWGVVPTLLRPGGPTEIPRSLVDIPDSRGAVQVAVGIQHGCLLTDNHRVKCWGDNHSHQLGDGTTVSHREAVLVPGLNDVASIAVHGALSCAVKTDGSVYCWGMPDLSELSHNPTGWPTPTVIENWANVVEVTLVDRYRCARLRTGEVSCWGHLPNSGSYVPTPQLLAGLSNISASYSTSDTVCYRPATGPILCMGIVPASVSVNPNVFTREPQPLALENVSSLSGGLGFICALIDGGTVRCHGNSNSGQLGDGTADHTQPVAVRW